MKIEIEPDMMFPKLEYHVISVGGRTVQTADSVDAAKRLRDDLASKGTHVRIVEITTLTIVKDID